MGHISQVRQDFNDKCDEIAHREELNVAQKYSQMLALEAQYVDKHPEEPNLFLDFIHTVQAGPVSEEMKKVILYAETSGDYPSRFSEDEDLEIYNTEAELDDFYPGNE